MTASFDPDPQTKLLGMQTLPVVTAMEWKAALEQLLVKENAHSKARDALAGVCWRKPCLAVEKN